MLIVLVSGCVSTRALEHARANAQACEHQEQVARAQGSPHAARIAADCGWWRTQVAIERERVETSRDRRRAAGAAMSGLGNAHRGTGRSVSCTSNAVGSTVYTDCN